MPRTVSAAACTALRTASLNEFGELPTTSVIRTTAPATWSFCSDTFPPPADAASATRTQGTRSRNDTPPQAAACSASSRTTGAGPAQENVDFDEGRKRNVRLKRAGGYYHMDVPPDVTSGDCTAVLRVARVSDVLLRPRWPSPARVRGHRPRGRARRRSDAAS